MGERGREARSRRFRFEPGTGEPRTARRDRHNNIGWICSSTVKQQYCQARGRDMYPMPDTESP